MINVYGLTGKTGAGKSTVSALLSKKGWFIIDGDVAAREITKPTSPVLKKLADAFGKDIIEKDGTLKRKELAARAFSTVESTQMLNRITHGAIDEIFRKQIEKAENAGFSKCVIDAAALLESPSKSLCKKIIVVTAPLEIRLERIMVRDGICENDAMTRINAQKNDEYYFERADIIIRNYPPFELKDEISKIE